MLAAASSAPSTASFRACLHNRLNACSSRAFRHCRTVVNRQTTTDLRHGVARRALLRAIRLNNFSALRRTRTSRTWCSTVRYMPSAPASMHQPTAPDPARSTSHPAPEPPARLTHRTPLANTRQRGCDRGEPRGTDIVDIIEIPDTAVARVAHHAPAVSTQRCRAHSVSRTGDAAGDVITVHDAARPATGDHN